MAFAVGNTELGAGSPVAMDPSPPGAWLLPAVQRVRRCLNKLAECFVDEGADSKSDSNDSEMNPDKSQISILAGSALGQVPVFRM